MKLLPFDLAKAQAGHPWGTRDGRKGKKIFDTERGGSIRLCIILEDKNHYFTTDNGIFCLESREHNLDLFLYEDEKIGWAVIYKDEFSEYGFNGQRVLNEEDKTRHEEKHKADGTYIDTVEVRY